MTNFTENSLRTEEEQNDKEDNSTVVSIGNNSKEIEVGAGPGSLTKVVDIKDISELELEVGGD